MKTLPNLRHPKITQDLLKTLANNQSLTVVQYDQVIKFLMSRREVQRKLEIGEELYGDEMTERSVNAETDFQNKITEILNKKSLIMNIEKKAPMTQNEKNELKTMLMQDEKIKSALAVLRDSMKVMN